MKARFGRLLTAMVTPFNDTLGVDLPRARELAQRLIQQGNDGLVVAGTTGEAPTLGKDEKLQLFKAVKEAVGANVSVIAGVGTNDTRATIENAKAAAGTGADGLLVVAPYYNKPMQSMLLRHYLEIAEAVELPIVVYNIPARTGVELLPETLARMAEHPRIVAVKQSLPDLDPVSDLAARLSRAKVPAGTGATGQAEPSMWIYSGDDTHTLSIMSTGGCGVISVAGHLVAKPMQEMMEKFEAGQLQQAQALHLKIFPLLKGLFAVTNPVLVKAALRMVGFPVGGLRPPLYAATPEEEARLAPLLTEQGLL